MEGDAQRMSHHPYNRETPCVPGIRGLRPSRSTHGDRHEASPTSTHKRHYHRAVPSKPYAPTRERPQAVNEAEQRLAIVESHLNIALQACKQTPRPSTIAETRGATLRRFLHFAVARNEPSIQDYADFVVRTLHNSPTHTTNIRISGVQFLQAIGDGMWGLRRCKTAIDASIDALYDEIDGRAWDDDLTDDTTDIPFAG